MILPRPGNNKGFTFIELLVVTTVIGVIFASGVVAFTSITVRSRDTRRKADLEAIRQSLEMCRSLSGEYPEAANVYQDDVDDSSLTCTTGEVLMTKVPVEPKKCALNTSGKYTYTRLTDTTYTLSSTCMEGDTSYQVKNP